MLNNINYIIMNRLSLIFSIIVFAISCVEVEYPAIVSRPGDDVCFNANVERDIETRTLYGDKATDGKSIVVNWVNGDRVSVYGTTCARKFAQYEIGINSTSPTNIADQLNKVADYGVQWGNGKSDFYSVFPAVDNEFIPIIGNSNDTTGVKVKTRISPNQYNTFKYDSQANTWVGQEYDYRLKEASMTDAVMYAVTPGVDNGTVVNLTYRPYVSALKFTLPTWHGDDQLGEVQTGKSIVLRSISITAPSGTSAIAGDFTLSIYKNGNPTVDPMPEVENNTITIIPSEQFEWMYGQNLEFKVFIIPEKNRDLSKEQWTITIDTSGGKKKLKLTPSITNNMDSILKPGLMHESKLPAIPIKSTWEVKPEEWIKDVPRNVYLSELSLPGAWYCYHTEYQDKPQDVEDIISYQYSQGIRAFHIDTRLTYPEAERNIIGMYGEGKGQLALICSGTDHSNSAWEYYGGDSVLSALQSIGASIKPTEYAMVVLTIAEKPMTRSGNIYGSISPSEILGSLKSILDVHGKTLKVFGYTDQTSDKMVADTTTVRSVLNHMIIKINLNTNYDNFKSYKFPKCILVSEGSMASESVGYMEDYFTAGIFNTPQTRSMYWVNSKYTLTDSGINYVYHQAQRTSSDGSIVPSYSQRTTSVQTMLSNLDAEYKASSHNKWFQIGLGGSRKNSNQTDSQASQGEVAATLNPTVANYVTAALQSQQPSPVGVVLMNFCTVDKITEDGVDYDVNGLSISKDIIELNNKTPLNHSDASRWDN